jgi:hypothetical protein
MVVHCGVLVLFDDQSKAELKIGLAGYGMPASGWSCGYARLG